MCDLPTPPMHLGAGSASADRLEGQGDATAAALMALGSFEGGSRPSSQGQRLQQLLLPSEDAGENHIGARSGQRAKRQSSADANTAASMPHARSNPLPASMGAPLLDGVLDSVSLSCRPAAALSAGEAEAGTDRDAGEPAAARRDASHGSLPPAAVSVSTAPAAAQQQQEQQQSNPRPAKVKGELSRQLGSSPAAASAANAACGDSPSSPPPQALLSWMTSNGISPEALEALKALLNQASAVCKGAGAAEQAPGPKQKQQRQEDSSPAAPLPAAAAQPQQVPVSGSQSNKRHWSSSTESPPAVGTVLVGSEGSAGLPLASAPSGQLQQYMQQYQSEPGIGAHPTLAVHLADEVGDKDGDADVDGGDDDVGSSSGGEDDGEEGGASPGAGQAGTGRPQRIGTGAGRRLKYEDLQVRLEKHTAVGRVQCGCAKH